MGNKNRKRKKEHKNYRLWRKNKKKILQKIKSNNSSKINKNKIKSELFYDLFK